MSVPVEIVDRYNAGEREIFVSADVFEAFKDVILLRGGFLDRIGPCRPFNERPHLNYKDARVSVARPS